VLVGLDPLDLVTCCDQERIQMFVEQVQVVTLVTQPEYNGTGLCKPLSVWHQTGTNKLQAASVHDETVNQAISIRDSKSREEVLFYEKLVIFHPKILVW